MANEKILTIITAPKAFRDPHITTIQRNAFRSWKELGDQVQVLVVGADAGVEQNTKDLELLHFDKVKCNQLGTPLIDSMLEIARQETQSLYLGIVNADIILLPDLLNAIKRSGDRFEKFLLVGQRWDIEIRYELNYDELQPDRLKQKIISEGKLHPPMGSDFFIFPRSCFTQIPRFAIGRAGWDNWFIFKSRWEGWPVIDATNDVIIAHQTHDYRHLPGGQTHYRLPETYENVKRGGGEHTIFTLKDAQYQLIEGRFNRIPLTGKKVLRELEILPLTKLKSHLLGKIFFYLVRPKKAYTALRDSIHKINR